MRAGWTLWARKRWEDQEPDIFSMSVESSQPNTKRHVVVSGNATWLTVEQAKEVAEFLQACIALCEQGPTEDSDGDFYNNMPIREMFAEEDRQCRALDENGFRKE